MLDPKGAKEWMKKGIAAYNERDYKYAIKCFEKAATKDNTQAKTFTYLGNAHYKRCEIGLARQHWKKAIKTEPRSAAAKKAREKLKKLKEKEREGEY